VDSVDSAKRAPKDKPRWQAHIAARSTSAPPLIMCTGPALSSQQPPVLAEHARCDLSELHCEEVSGEEIDREAQLL
jgi:hypothetical protein